MAALAAFTTSDEPNTSGNEPNTSGNEPNTSGNEPNTSGNEPKGGFGAFPEATFYRQAFKLACLVALQPAMI